MSDEKTPKLPSLPGPPPRLSRDRNPATPTPPPASTPPPIPVIPEYEVTLQGGDDGAGEGSKGAEQGSLSDERTDDGSRLTEPKKVRSRSKSAGGSNSLPSLAGGAKKQKKNSTKPDLKAGKAGRVDKKSQHEDESEEKPKKLSTGLAIVIAALVAVPTILLCFFLASNILGTSNNDDLTPVIQTEEPSSVEAPSSTEEAPEETLPEETEGLPDETELTEEPAPEIFEVGSLEDSGDAIADEEWDYAFTEDDYATLTLSQGRWLATEACDQLESMDNEDAQAGFLQWLDGLDADNAELSHAVEIGVGVYCPQSTPTLLELMER